MVDFQPQKDDPNRVRIPAGGNLIKYPGELTTRTADFTTSKLLWNSVISTDDARFAALDVGNFYLETPLERYEYMRLPLKHFPEHTIEQYNLRENAKMAGYTLKSARRFTASHKLASWPTTNSNGN